MPVLRFSLHHLKSEGDSEEWCVYDANGNKVYLCYSAPPAILAAIKLDDCPNRKARYAHVLARTAKHKVRIIFEKKTLKYLPK